MLGEERPPLVIDLGSGMVKAGFAGEDEPCSVFPSIVGTPLVTSDAGMTYVGRRARYKGDKLTLREPIKHGVVTDWDDVETLLDHTFHDQLQVAPHEHQMLLTEPPLNPKTNREKMTQIVFEKYDAPSMYLAIQGVLSLYASDKTTGVVVDSGHGVTHIIPVYEGYAIEHAMQRLEYGGGELTNYLIQLLAKRGHDFTKTADRSRVGDMKEQLCYVAADFEAELTSLGGDQAPEKQTTFKLHDGRSIVLEKERFMCPELLFKPSLSGVEATPVHKALHTSLTRCEVDIRSALYTNIILSGGSTMFPGFPARLQREMELLSPTARRTRIEAPSKRKFSVWKGGSILASLSSFQRMLITKEEYQESGADIVHRKCF